MRISRFEDEEFAAFLDENLLMSGIDPSWEGYEIENGAWRFIWVDFVVGDWNEDFEITPPLKKEFDWLKEHRPEMFL